MSVPRSREYQQREVSLVSGRHHLTQIIRKSETRTHNDPKIADTQNRSTTNYAIFPLEFVGKEDKLEPDTKIPGNRMIHIYASLVYPLGEEDVSLSTPFRGGGFTGISISGLEPESSYPYYDILSFRLYTHIFLDIW